MRTVPVPHDLGLARPTQVKIVISALETLSLEHIQQNSIDSVIKRTIARSGLAGILTGNTAELHLPRVQCSLLALDPDDFQSPVHVW